jgi:hypothetical protein
MTRLEDFFSSFAAELGIVPEAQGSQISGKLNDLRVMYIKAEHHTEIFSICNNDVEVRLVQYSGKDEMSLCIGLPSLNYSCYLEKLGNDPLSRYLKEQFSNRDKPAENSKFLEYADIKDTAPAKELIYKLLL